MHPIHDVDAVLLLAVALASKRRPAELVEIVAAADVIQGVIPSESKLSKAFYRFSIHGLICAAEGGFALTPDAQEMVADLPRKADTKERIFSIRERLAAYEPQGEHAPIQLSAEEIGAAILAHRASAQGAGKNLLMPKPKEAEADKRRPGQWRKAGFGSRRRG